jgi:hypothetical protein
MKDIDNLDAFASYSVQNAIGCFNEFTNAGPFVTMHCSAETGKSCQLIATPQNRVDRAVRSLLGFCDNVSVDVGERS